MTGPHPPPPPAVLTTTAATAAPLSPLSPPPSPSLWKFLSSEVTRGYLVELEEERFASRRDKVYMFLVVPREVERLMGYGFFLCMDAFLYLLTFLPLRVAHSLVSSKFGCGGGRVRMGASSVCDGLKLLVLVVVVYLFLFIDTSVLYHLVKSQSVIKLYIFFNMLEVGDRLFASFVQDTIDALFLTATEDHSSSSQQQQQQQLPSSPSSRRRKMSVGSHLCLVVFAVFGHALVILLQGTTLSVAINASNRALLTVMMSNNFVELKGAVFKKFDKINLFQVSCSDVRERFHLVVLLLVVCLQTMREYSWEEARFWVLFPDCLMVLLAEVGVDWVKHCFITRFNELDAEVYREYTLSLAYDLAQTKQRGRAFSDHSDMVGRRLGFVPLPLAVVLIRVLRPCFGTSITPATLFLTTIAFVALASFRTLSSIILLGKACDLIDHHHHHGSSSSAGPLSSPSPQHLQQQQVKEEQQPEQPVVKDEDDGDLNHFKIPPVPLMSTTTAPPPSSISPPPPPPVDVLSELLLRHRRRQQQQFLDHQMPPPPPPPPKFVRSMSASGSPRGSLVADAGGPLNNKKGEDEYGWGGCPLESSFGRMLPANSAVSVLSVQFNEEMIKATSAAAAAAADETAAAIKTEPSHQLLTRKHSLGSCLAQSEHLLQLHQQQQQRSDEEEEDLVKKTQEDDGDDDEVYYDQEDVVVEEVRTSLRDLSIASHDLGTTSAAAASSVLQPSSAAPLPPPPLSPSTSPVTTNKRVKKKSLTGWLKELGGGNSSTPQPPPRPPSSSSASEK